MALEQQPTLALEPYVWTQVPNATLVDCFFGVNKMHKVMHSLGALAPTETEDYGFLTNIDSIYRAPAGTTVWVMTPRKNGSELQYALDL